MPEPMRALDTVRAVPGAVRLIDQTRLPHELIYHDCTDVREMIEAIRALRVRGAPAIGVAAAYMLALVAEKADTHSMPRLHDILECAADELVEARPTAVNLAWAIQRMRGVWEGLAMGPDAADMVVHLLREEAEAIRDEDLAMSERMGRAGADLLPPDARVLTHCNTGGLATAGLGTALAVVFAAHAAGKNPTVLADETRPLLQGARLTAWECQQRGIPVQVLADGAAGWAMASGLVDVVLIGADRVVANGDTANKIGSYPLAVLAKRHEIPFYVVMPSSTIDTDTEVGAEIPIEQRTSDEVTRGALGPIAPEGVPAYNPAFDVTPAELITGWITERGVVQPPFA